MENSHIAFVILGASGDLTKRKIMPALVRLFEQKVLDDTCAIIGSGRSAFTDDEFRKLFDVPEGLQKKLFYHQGIKGLRTYIMDKCNFDRIIVFMSLPPDVYVPTVRELHENGFADETSIIIEKPFGYDYDSAVELDRVLSECFNEKQIYRNDHYLAKEPVQNILVFRFANQIFQPLWNSQNIESIEISATETQGIGNRGPYFDKAGIIRDMAQNHLMQLLSLMTMEPPLTLDPAEISAKKIDLYRSLKIDQCCRYQYDTYRSEKGVNPDSRTETYAELKLSINNFRWAGMPIYMRCGKALDRTGTEISVRFRRLPRILFNEKGDVQQNTIIFKIQPSEGVIVNMSSKEPGSEIRLMPTNMTFCYIDSFKGELPEAYQKILIDVLRKDHTLFVTAQETELLWKVIEPAIGCSDLKIYKKGEMPPTVFDMQWTDFDKYSNSCKKEY